MEYKDLKEWFESVKYTLPPVIKHESRTISQPLKLLQNSFDAIDSMLPATRDNIDLLNLHKAHILDLKRFI